MVGSIKRAHTPGRTGRCVASVISALYTELLVLVALPAGARARRQSIARHIILHSICNITHIILHIYIAAEHYSPLTTRSDASDASVLGAQRQQLTHAWALL